MFSFIDTILSLPWWGHVLILTWAMYRIGPFNHAVAWLCGAPWGRSMSAYLWALQEGKAVPRWIGSWRMDTWPPGTAVTLAFIFWCVVWAVRLFVDFWPWAAFKDAYHCRTAYQREAV